MEAPELDRFYRERNQEAAVLAVAVGDSDPAIRQFMSSGGFTFPLMVDPGTVGADYGIDVIPTLVLIDAQGRVARTVSGVVSTEELVSMVEDLAGR